MSVTQCELEKLLFPIKEILERGNNAEIKCTKDGVIVLEVQKTIRGKV